jgi:hypothetical protein
MSRQSGEVTKAPWEGKGEERVSFQFAYMRSVLHQVFPCFAYLSHEALLHAFGFSQNNMGPSEQRYAHSMQSNI